MSSEIVKVEESPTQMWRQTTDRASLVKEVVLRSTVAIQGKRYLTVAGYQAIANSFGCVASARDAEYIQGIGWKCIGEVRRMSDGVVISTGIGLVGDDEKVWQGRPMFARLAMAQTRSCGRALRAAFAFMAPIIDNNLETTPYEEMALVVESQSASPVAQRTDDLKAKLAASVALVNKHLGQATTTSTATVTAAPRPAPRATSGGPVALPNYGKHKGEPISGADMATLEFYANGARRSLADETKARWHAREQALLDALMDEMARREGGNDEEPPPHSDGDAPPEAF